jgi:hypothetical protein
VTSSWSSSTYNEFTLEALRIEEMVWAALAVQPHSEIVFCGYENSKSIIERALAIGAKVTVIDSQSDGLRAASELGIEAIRASTTNIPIKNDRFALAIAHHYLHEVDPTYHTQILSELGRIARNIAIVEPGPPSDLLGSRIASLYSRAKRRLGQFEQYQNMEHWRRLLLGIRAHVTPAEIRYAHLPPKAFLHETMAMVLDSVKIAGAPEDDLKALRGVAQASDAQLVPQPRYVLLAGMSAADIPDRPRFHELQKQAPERQTIRLKRRSKDLDLPHFADPASPEITYQTSRIAETTTARRRRGIASWFQQPEVHEPLPLALPGTSNPVAVVAQQNTIEGPAHIAPLKDVTKRTRRPFSGKPDQVPGFGFGSADESEPNSIATRFAIPQMEGSDSLEWSENNEGFGF